MRLCLRMIVVALSCLLMNGCIVAATRGIGTIERQTGVGDDFRSWQSRMPPIPADKGRIVVYPGGSRSFVYEATGIGKGGEQLFTVDKDVCTVLGHSFIYLDLPRGTHEISADGVSKLLGYQKGRNKLSVEIRPATVTYIRIDKAKGGAFSRSHYFPKLVEAPAAATELKELPIYTTGLSCRPNRAEERAKPG